VIVSARKEGTMSLRRRVDNLEMVLSQMNLKIFGTEVYLDRPLSVRLTKTEAEAHQATRRCDILDDCVSDLVENSGQDAEKT